MKYKAVILLVNVIVLLRKGSFQTNPCPDVFQFKWDGQKNYGIITIPPPGKGLTILKIKIAIRYPTEGDTTELNLLKSLHDTLKDAEKGRDVQYTFHFPQSPQLPNIETITLNNKNICNGPKIHNIHKFYHEYKIENPKGATQLAHIPYRHSTPPPATVIPSVYEISTSKPFAPPINPDTVGNPWLPARTTTKVPEGNPWLPNRHLTPSLPPILPSSSVSPPPVRTTSPPHPVTPTPVPRIPTTTVRDRDKESDGSWLEKLPFAGTCGRVSALQPTQLIIGGIEITQGEFPWMVAMFHYVKRSIEYKCGATLISNTYVLTAVHCTKNQLRVHLEFGRHNISDLWEAGYTYRASIKIIEHPDYVTGADNDVALISFDHVEFTPRIQPICLWAHGSRFDNIVATGTVTGWGQIDNDATGSSIPMKLNVSMVRLDTCRKSQETFQNIASVRTFCAGGQSKGPCHGDSGSGFYIRHNKVWYLRGIVSTSLGTAYTCNVDEYAVYADLAYFLDWIRPYLLS